MGSGWTSKKWIVIGAGGIAATACVLAGWWAIRSYSPLEALAERHGLVFVHPECAWSRKGASYVGRHSERVLPVPVARGKTAEQRSLSSAWCQTCLAQLNGLHYGLVRLATTTDQRCSWLMAEGITWLDENAAEPGVPAWRQGERWIGAGLTAEMLDEFGIPVYPDELELSPTER